MNKNPYQSPENAESNEPVVKLPIGLIAFQGVMTIAAVLIYFVWMPYLKDAFEEFGLDLSLLSRHFYRNATTYLMVGVLAANGLFVLMLVNKLRGRKKQSRTWGILFVVFWILFLIFSVMAAYGPVLAIRSGGVDLWL